MINRRRFLQLGSLAGAACLVPPFLRVAALSPKLSGKKIVLLYLSGGNDGLNTVVPYRNDVYYRLRPRLSLTPKELLRLNDEAGLHPALTALRAIYEQGEMCMIHSVGYAHPERSHFQSALTWNRAHVDRNVPTGWLGRVADEYGQQTVCAVGSVQREILQGVRTNGVVLEEDATAFVPGAAKANELCRKLLITAQSIANGAAPSIYYLEQGGYDTHVHQRQSHRQLLTELNEGLNVFATVLKKTDEWKNTLLVVVSEFGRRVAENPFGGTDHGAANNVLVMGGGISKPGSYNSLPDLENLDNGDIRHTIDFRQVYATLLNGWLHADPARVMGQSYQQLSFI